MSDYRDSRNDNDLNSRVRRVSEKNMNSQERRTGNVQRTNTSGRQMTDEERRRRALRRKAALKKRRRKKVAMLLAACAVIIAIIVAVILIVSGSRNNAKQAANETTEIVTEEVVTTKPERHEVSLVSVGDVLMHTPLINYADQGNGTYDFNSIFAETKDLIQAADIAICNQETPIDPTKEPDGGIQFIFNTPPEIADAEINAGFDIVLQSSNHSYDMGADGIINTAEFWKTKSDQAKMIGMYTSQEERDSIFTYEKNGITFAMYNCTYGLNGFALPDDQPYLTNLLVDENYDMIVSDIKKAKEAADFVIVFPHWGVEDVVKDVTEYQEYWGKVFTEAGADLIIGTHPHVCEKIEWIEAGGNKALCYYSLGNFASNQQELPEVLCGMARVNIVKEGDNTYIDESKTGVTPVVTHNTNMGYFVNNVVVYELSDYTEELASQHDIAISFDNTFSKARLDELAEDIFGDWIIA